MLEKPKPKLPKSELLRFQTAISYTRLQSYKIHPQEQDMNLVSTHLWNTVLSESLYPALHNCEIAIRNNFNRAISELLYNEDWLLDRNRRVLDNYEEKKVESAIGELEKNNKRITRDNLISKLDFGFWVSLSSAKYEGRNKFYPELFRNADFFPHLPKQKRTRKILSTELTSIRKLRNQVFHHNCIWNKQELSQEYSTILEVIKWVSPIMFESTAKISRFPEMYKQGRESCIEIIRSFTDDDFTLECP